MGLTNGPAPSKPQLLIPTLATPPRPLTLVHRRPWLHHAHWPHDALLSSPMLTHIAQQNPMPDSPSSPLFSDL